MYRLSKAKKTVTNNLLKMKTKRIMSKMLISLSLVGLLMSCSTSNEVVSNGIFQKRKYKKGWYINSNDNIAKKSIKEEEKNNSSVKEEVNDEIVQIPVIKLEEKQISTNETNVPLISKEYLKENKIPSDNKIDKKLLVSNNENSVLSTLTPLKIAKYSLESMNKQKEINKKSETKSGGVKILLIILAFFIPFLASGIATGWKDLIWLYTLLWTLLFFLPGLIHAIIVISKN